MQKELFAEYLGHPDWLSRSRFSYHPVDNSVDRWANQRGSQKYLYFTREELQSLIPHSPLKSVGLALVDRSWGQQSTLRLLT